MKKFLVLAATIILNFVPLYGVLWLGWHISDIFFWYWFEFMIDLIFAYARLRNYWKRGSGSNPAIKKFEKTVFWPFVFLFTFFITLFTLIPVMGDLVGSVTSWADYGVLWQYLLGKKYLMLILILSGFIGFWYEKISTEPSFSQILKPLRGKAFVISAFYLILMVQYHLSGADKIPAEHQYLLFEIIAFVFARIIVDSIINLNSKPASETVIIN